MLLFFLLVSCVPFGSSAYKRYEDTCYGSRYRIPIEFAPYAFSGSLYFTPSSGKPRILLMELGRAIDTRVEVGFYKVIVKDMRENGRFSIQDPGKEEEDIIELDVRDCSTKVKKYYGDWYYFTVPRFAEYLDFTPSGTELTLILWNRTNPQGNLESRGKMKPSSWEVTGLTQSDNGHYSFRAKDNTLLSRIKLLVEGRADSYDATEGEQVRLPQPRFSGSWTVTFTPEGQSDTLLVMRNGEAVSMDRDLIETTFENRLHAEYDGIVIDPVVVTDTGVFEYRDKDDNLAQSVTLIVFPGPESPLVHVGIAAGFVLALIVFCCCLKKCCCKKSSSKRDQSAPAAVYHHGPNESGGPSYSAAPAAATPPDISYRPKYPPAITEPSAAFTRPSAFKKMNIHVNPLQSEAASTAGQGDAPAPAAGQQDAPAPSLNMNRLVPDYDQTYELKGKFSSASPLGSDSTVCDVYVSDKLNFNQRKK